MAKHIAVLMGGWSAEREVSLKSGEACASALERAGFRVSRIDVDRDIANVLQELKPDVVFNALHGVFGEDGVVQGVLETLQIPYTHSGVLSSALAMHKEKAKIVMAAHGVPVAEGVVIHRSALAEGHPIEPPYVLKPVVEGSSVGVVIVEVGQNAPPAAVMANDWAHGDILLAEKFVAGRELTCAVMGDKALGVIDIVANASFYDYTAKYAKGGSKHILPAEISPNIYQTIQRLSLAAHQALGCRGISRADFRYDDTAGGTGELICLEVNTQPGMTETSLVPEMAAYEGYSFEELVTWIVEDASINR